MAADYTTGISSSPTNLLTTLVSWLSSQGWTVDLSASDGTGWRAHLHKSGLYVNLRAAMDEEIWYRAAGPLYHDYGDGGYGLGLYLGTGFDGGDPWYDQAGGPVSPSDGSTMGAGANLPPGSVAAYHFFDDGADNIVVVVERSPGVFCHLGFGPAMSDAGQPEDFSYFFGSSSAHMTTHDGAAPGDSFGFNLSALPPMSHGNSEVSSISGSVPRVHACAYVRVDAATYSARWIGNSHTNDNGYGATGRLMRCALNLNPYTESSFDEEEYPNFVHMLERTHQSAFVGALLLPLPCFVLTDPGARWAPIGNAPSIYWTEAVGHGYAAGDVYAIGGVDYMLFPHFAIFKGA